MGQTPCSQCSGPWLWVRMLSLCVGEAKPSFPLSRGSGWGRAPPLGASALATPSPHPRTPLEQAVGCDGCGRHCFLFTLNLYSKPCDVGPLERLRQLARVTELGRRRRDSNPGTSASILLPPSPHIPMTSWAFSCLMPPVDLSLSSDDSSHLPAALPGSEPESRQLQEQDSGSQPAVQEHLVRAELPALLIFT